MFSMFHPGFLQVLQTIRMHSHMFLNKVRMRESLGPIWSYDALIGIISHDSLDQPGERICAQCSKGQHLL